jgi:hypothetical protein
MAQEKSGSLNVAARTSLPLDRGVLVIVGDKKTVLPQLKELGLRAPVEVDAWGGPAGK